jgi:multiple sugar transport system permease protein
MASALAKLDPLKPGNIFGINLKKRTRDNIAGYLFVSPWIFSLLVFTLYPMIASFYFAMTEYNIISPPKFIGLRNFETMFTGDPLYWKSVGNTAYYVFLSVPLGLLFGLILALLLNQKIKGIGFYRTAFYLPGLVPAVASTLLWIVLLDPRLGLINAFLDTFGIEKIGWLRSATWSKPALILMALWGGSGGTMLIFLAALKEIPQSLMEAAMMDGANVWQRFTNVTIPMISPTIFFNLVMSIIGSFQVFASAFVAGTGATAGPLNTLLMYMLLLYRNAFRYFNMGYASAMALVLFLVLVLLTLLLIRSSSAWVYYETGGRR